METEEAGTPPPRCHPLVCPPLVPPPPAPGSEQSWEVALRPPPPQGLPPLWDTPSRK